MACGRRVACSDAGRRKRPGQPQRVDRLVGAAPAGRDLVGAGSGACCGCLNGLDRKAIDDQDSDLRVGMAMLSGDLLWRNNEIGPALHAYSRALLISYAYNVQQEKRRKAPNLLHEVAVRVNHQARGKTGRGATAGRQARSARHGAGYHAAAFQAVLGPRARLGGSAARAAQVRASGAAAAGRRDFHTSRRTR